MTGSTHFPFPAIVGQEDMKDALLCNAVNPGIGGVLIAGTRGTAKSTAARSLAHLLPRIQAVADCAFDCPPGDPSSQCDRCADRDFGDRPDLIEEIRTPFVDLPIGATEDRVLGTIDLEAAIQEGERSFEPGLLARANRGILYVDEVNLLGDHLVDVLLDAVATGTNRVEREGVSFEHPSDVMLVGTMNPEEGELRPQLLDRFGLYVEMDRELTPAERKAVVRRRTQYDDDPEGTMAEWAAQERDLADRIVAARERVDDVRVDDETLDRIVDLCVEHEVDGLRADIVVHRTARTLAALDGEGEVREAHVTRAAELALGHRSRSRPSPDPRGPDPAGDEETDRGSPANVRDKPDPGELPGTDRSAGTPDGEGSYDGGEMESNDDGEGGSNDGGDRATGDGGEGETRDREGDESSDRGGTVDGEDGDDGDGGATGRAGATEDSVFQITAGIAPPPLATRRRTERPGPAGRGGRTHAITNDGRGAYCGARRPRGPVTDLALDATVRAAAPHQVARRSGGGPGPALRLRPSDLREKRRQSRARNLMVFVVDSSGSMGAYERMSAVKGAILSLLEDAYQQRDYVSLVGFRGDGAETLLSPTSSVSRAAHELADMPTGGRTPLAAGLERGLEVVERERGKRSDVDPLLVVVTDGRSNYAGTGAPPVREALDRADRIRRAGVPAVCFDTEAGPVRMGIVRRLADRMSAAYYRFDELDPGSISEAVEDVFYGVDRRPG